MLRKITRILFRTFLLFFLFSVILCISLFFAVQSHTFQTWLGHKAAQYMSSELNTKVEIRKINIDFFSKAYLEGVYVTDQHKDTLLNGDLLVDIDLFDYKARKLKLGKIQFRNLTAKLIEYEKDSSLNYQFLYDYFAKGKKDTVKSAGKPWDVSQGDIFLENVTFVYRNRNKDNQVSQNMNFNNLAFYHTNGKISRLKIDSNIIYANIHNFSTREQCGFELKQLTAKTKVSDKELLLEKMYIKTPQTVLKGELSFKYNGWNDYNDFLNKIKITSRLNESYLCFKDVAAFTSELNGLNETIHLSGRVKGYVSDLNLTDFKLQYGHYTRFDGNLTLTGLPEIANCFLHFDAKQISTNYLDIEKLPQYPFHEGKKLQIPTQLKTLGTISYRGKFDGFLNDFTTYGDFKTALGGAITDLSIKTGKKSDDLSYTGKIKTESFDLGTLIGVKGLKNVTLNAEIKGKGVNIHSLNTKLEGHVLNVTFNGYDYKNIVLDGTFKEKIFSGLFMSKDPNADFDFDGKVNFSKKVPEMDFMATINKFDFKELHFTKKPASISSQVLIIVKGDNLNNLSGTVNFDDTKFTTLVNDSSKTYNFSTFDLKLDQETPDKKITLTSSYFNFDMGGQFNMANLPIAFNNFLNSYYPAFVAKIKTKTPLTDAFKFNLKIKKYNVISELVTNNLMLSPGTVLSGDFDITKNLFNFNLKSDSINYGKIKFSNDAIESYSQNNKINLVFKSSEIKLTDSVKLYNYFSYFVSKDKDTKFNFEWDNKAKPANKGKLFGKVTFNNNLATFNFEKLFVTARDSTWNLVTTNPFVIDSVGRLIVNPLRFESNNQSISLGGVLSEQPSDSLVLKTENVVLEQFNPLFQAIGLTLEGVMNGKVTVHNLKTLAVGSDLVFSRFKLNNNPLGQLVLKTDYNSRENNIFLRGYTSLELDNSGILSNFIDPLSMPTQVSKNKNISFSGYYYLGKKEESIDIDFGANYANLKLLNPFIEGILTINKAYVSGDGKIHGSPDNIKIDGKLKLKDSEIKVDYTNVIYNMTGDIEIMPDQIRFTEWLMYEKGAKKNGAKAVPQGTINGNIFHNNFSKIQLDYDVTYRNMLVLNTTEKENKTFYGRLYGTGQIGIWGFLNKLHMQVIDTTNKNSKFILPLDGPAEVEESDFIHFVKKDTIKVIKDDRLTGFDLEMFVNVTPDQQSQIILDKKTGDILNVQGLGDLTLKISTLGKFEMIGDYLITNGDYRFTLENVINKKFDIDAGSSISWSGDPLGAEINVITSYRQRASVAPLLNDTTGMYKGRVPADCKLKIAGKLFSPNIKFGIDFPTIDATARSRIENLLSDEAELNRQVFSFLLFRSFVTPQIYNANGGGVTAGFAAASSGSEMLSNQVSNFLNSYVGNLTGLGDLNLGVNYRPGTQTNKEAVDLALSKQLFNNKVTFAGNFGVNGNNTSSAGGKNSSGIIDVNIEYKLTDDGRYRLKGFNRSNNTTQITTTGGPYTQGVGVFYREEFETFNQLFKRYLDKVNKNKKKEEPKKPDEPKVTEEPIQK